MRPIFIMLNVLESRDCLLSKTLKIIKIERVMIEIFVSEDVLNISDFTLWQVKSWGSLHPSTSIVIRSILKISNVLKR